MITVTMPDGTTKEVTGFKEKLISGTVVGTLIIPWVVGITTIGCVALSVASKIVTKKN